MRRIFQYLGGDFLDVGDAFEITLFISHRSLFNHFLGPFLRSRYFLLIALSKISITLFKVWVALSDDQHKLFDHTF